MQDFSYKLDSTFSVSRASSAGGSLSSTMDSCRHGLRIALRREHNDNLLRLGSSAIPARHRDLRAKRFGSPRSARSRRFIQTLNAARSANQNGSAVPRFLLRRVRSQSIEKVSNRAIHRAIDAFGCITADMRRRHRFRMLG